VRLAESLRRLPFARADIDALVAFCGAHASPFDGPLLRRLVLDLTSAPAGVIVLGDDAGIALAATVLDGTSNASEAANLEILARRAPIPAALFMRLVVEPALAFARAGTRRALHVVLPAATMPADGAEDALGEAGFAPVYSLFEMRRPHDAPAPPSPGPLPAGWSWAALDGARVDDAHAALTEMFRDALATQIVPLAVFRQAVLSGAAVWRVLLDGDRVAGLLRVGTHGGQGQLQILGRVPAYRGQGLGPRLVAEGLRLLGDGGARDTDLSVEADNESALALYRRFGFGIVTRTPVFGRALR